MTIVCTFSLAARADAPDLELVAQDPVVHRPARLFLEAAVDGDRQVVDAAAGHAPDVIVAARVGIEPRGLSSGVHLADRPFTGQLLQVAIHGGEADTRKTAPRL